MAEELEAILRRVAAGELTPEEAEPLVEAATAGAANRIPDGEPARAEGPGKGVDLDGDPFGEGTFPQTDARVQRTVRLEVLEKGRTVTTLRIPMSWASLANVVPGLSRLHADRIREAIRSGTVGPILEVQDEDGGGVIISTE